MCDTITLEYFFTLGKMKNGLTTLARVEELVSVLQKQKDWVLNSVDDASRQWSTVAHTIVATENMDSLSHFVQLNGISFLNHWLKKAFDCSNDVTNGVVEESVIAILGSLEKLPINREKLNSSGIRSTVERILGHRNFNAKEQAKLLLDKWNHVAVNDIDCRDTEKSQTCQKHDPNSLSVANTEHMPPGHAFIDSHPHKAKAAEGSPGVGASHNESQSSNITRCSEGSQLDTVDSVKISMSIGVMPSTSLNSLGSSIVSNSCHDNFSIAEESSVCPSGAVAFTGTCNSSRGRQRDVDDQFNDSMVKDVSDGEVMDAELNTKEGYLLKSSEKEMHNFSSSSGLNAISLLQKHVMEPAAPCNSDSNGSKSCSSNAAEPQPRTAGINCDMPIYFNSTGDLKMASLANKDFCHISATGCLPRKNNGREKGLESCPDSEELGTQSSRKISLGVHPVSPSYSVRSVGIMSDDLGDQTREVGLECGEIDALEVARQVAIEVEQEVVDYREAFSNSSPDISSGGIMGSHSPYIVEDNKDQLFAEESSANVSATENNLSYMFSPEDGSPRNVEITGTNLQNDKNLKSSTSVDQESFGKIDRSQHEFDLNEDVYAEDFNCSVNPIPINVVVSAPIAVVAPTKGSPDFSIIPLHFGGEMGWRGSASTSAFRPVLPQKALDDEKACSNTKEKQKFLKIDLNVVQSEQDLAANLISVKQVSISSGFPSNKSAMEVCSRKAEKLNLDLNRHGDEDVPSHLSSFQMLECQNGDKHTSASSSSLRQPSMRDFDLNDNLSVFDAGIFSNFTKASSSKASGIYGRTDMDDPDIMILGSRIAVEKKDYVNQSHRSLPESGLSMETSMERRAVFPHAHMLLPYGHNGHATRPSMSAPLTLYGHGEGPYMVDSRGATLVPQILGTLGPSGALASKPPLVMSMASIPSSSNSVGSSRSCLDLNFGMTLGENRDSVNFKQLVMPVHNGLVDEQTTPASQPCTSGTTLKRKLPDLGWDPYPFSHRQTT